MSNYHKLYTPEDSAVVFIDHQPRMLFGVANAGRAEEGALSETVAKSTAL